MIFLSTIKQDILEVGKRLYTKGFVASNDGNISVRVDDKSLLITPTGVCKGDLEAEDLLLVDYEGNVLSGVKTPTSEMKMHLAIYKARPDAKAIVHAHPQNATAFAVAGLPLDKITLPEVIFSLGKIALAEYGTPSTNQVPDAVSKVIKVADCILLANHGALTVGSSIMDAYFKMEILDHFAAITLKARALGGEKVLDEKEQKELFRIRSEVYGKKGPYCTNCGVCTDGKQVKDRLPACVVNTSKIEDESVKKLTESVVSDVLNIINKRL